MTPESLIEYAEDTLKAARANADAARRWADKSRVLEEELAVARATLERARRAVLEETAKREELEGIVTRLEVEVESLQEQLEGQVEPEPDPDPPVEPPDPSLLRWFYASDAANRSASENKRLLGELLNRATRKTRRMIRPGWTETATTASDFGDIDFRAQWQWALNVALGADISQKAGNIDIERCSFAPGQDTVTFKASEKMKWGMRRYNLGDVYVGDCDFFDIPEEHGIYDSLSGHGYYRGCTFKDIGSQALQIAYRDQPYQQYGADNAPLTKQPIIMVEDCHAVDSGRHGTRPSFAYTFFDPGTAEHPGIVILRDTTYVADWETPRYYNGRELRSTGGLVIHQYQQTPGGAPATEHAILTNTVWDSTKGDRALIAIRGVENILFHDSTFIARDHPQPFVDIDDEPAAADSRFVVIQNTVSPGGATVKLRLRRKEICSMHQPGRRVVVDVERGEIVSEGPTKDEPLTRLVHPLVGKIGTVPSGRTEQPVGHVDDMPEQPLQVRD